MILCFQQLRTNRVVTPRFKKRINVRYWPCAAKPRWLSSKQRNTLRLFFSGVASSCICRGILSYGFCGWFFRVFFPWCDANRNGSPFDKWAVGKCRNDGAGLKSFQLLSLLSPAAAIVAVFVAAFFFLLNVWSDWSALVRFPKACDLVVC
jgi:hypothetical protein